jgi:hypothetical protein
MGEAIKENVEVCTPMVGMEPNSLISLEVSILDQTSMVEEEEEEEEEEEDAVVVVVVVVEVA